MSEFTKGEWEIKEESDGHYGIYPKESAECIAVVWSADELDAEANAEELVRRWNAFEKDFNVRLVVAAPKLLAACEFAKAQIKKGSQKKALLILRAAIDKYNAGRPPSPPPRISAVPQQS